MITFKILADSKLCHICHEHTVMRGMFLVNEHMLRKLSITFNFYASCPVNHSICNAAGAVCKA